jgi:hypothetical protein
MKSINGKEEKALQRLRGINQDVYFKFDEISLRSPEEKMILEKLFTTPQNQIGEMQVEIRIKDLPKKPEEL